MNGFLSVDGTCVLSRLRPWLIGHCKELYYLVIGEHCDPYYRHRRHLSTAEEVLNKPSR